MKILDIFKNKPRRVLSKQRSKKPEESKIEKPQEAKAPKIKKEPKIGQSYRLLRSPHVTEKATDLTEKNQYAFRVFTEANKTELKKAVGAAYGVDVVSVRIINVHKKKKRLGKIRGTRPGYKKAIVKIKKGQKIELLPR